MVSAMSSPSHAVMKTFDCTFSSGLLMTVALDVDQGGAEILYRDPTEIGTVSDTGIAYVLKFPETDLSFESVIIINKKTGEFQMKADQEWSGSCAENSG